MASPQLMELGGTLPDLSEIAAMLTIYGLAWFLCGAFMMWLIWPWMHRKHGGHHRTHAINISPRPRPARPVVSGGRHRSPPSRR